MPAPPINKLDSLRPGLRRAWFSGEFETRYRITDHLGSGGMGHVVAAVRKSDRRPVAIKFLAAENCRSPNAIRRFFREARAAARITSPYAVRLLDRGRLDDGTPYLVMERLYGMTLGELIAKEGPLSVATATTYILQACHAIAQAHSLGIIHRDLKPANLFLADTQKGDAWVKVLDFGVSKLVYLDDSDGLTQTGDYVGSPRFMAPEQIRSSRKVDLRADIWSLGATLYQLLSGHHAFRAESRGALIAQVLHDPPDSITRHQPDLPVELVALVERCLSKDRERRPRVIPELAIALQPFADAEGQKQAAATTQFTPHPSSLAESPEDLIETEGDSPRIEQISRAHNPRTDRRLIGSGAWRPRLLHGPTTNSPQIQTSAMTASLPQLEIPRPVRLLNSDGSCSYGSWRHVGVIVGIRPPRFSSVNLHRELVDSLVEEYPYEATVLVVIKHRSTPPPDVRDALVQLFRQTGAQLQATALVVEASGFAGSLQRGIITALLMASGHGGNVRAFESIRGASDWIAGKALPDDWSRGSFVTSLIAATNEFCASEVARWGHLVEM